MENSSPSPDLHSYNHRIFLFLAVFMGKKKSRSGDDDLSGEGSSKYEHPSLKPNRIDTRSVRAIVKLAAPVCPLLEFIAEVSPSTTVKQIGEKIIDRHGGSIKDLSICVNRFHPEEILSPERKLEDVGIISGDCVIFYDFVPISAPLLA